MGALTEFSNHMDWQGMLLFLMSAVACLICLTIHELAHGLMARQLGDPTAKVNGRLTLNPLAHIDWVGLFLLLTVGVGWAKPVPTDARRFKHPKAGMAITALAGPAANLILAYLSMAVWKAVYYWAPENDLTLYATYFLHYMVLMNVGLAVFNLIPVPPFDGSRIALLFLPQRLYFKVMRYEHQIMIAVLLLALTGLLNIPLSVVVNFLWDRLVDLTAFMG